jgi:ATP-dependent Clp protease ATP-binding subunit ClpA
MRKPKWIGKDGKLDPVIGRDEEIWRIANINP